MVDRLEYLLALAQEKHFGRAAAACGTTQPTLSAGIKQLEESLGTLLVERGSRFRGFTEAGERVLVWARRIVGDLRAMRQDVAAMQSALSGRLRIAAIPTALPMLTALTTALAQHYPELHLVILSRTSDEVLSMLSNLEVDAGVTYLDNEPLRQVVAVPLYRERLCVVCAAGSDLAGRSSVAWSDLQGRRLCLLTPDMQNRRIIDRAMATAGASAVVTLESDSMLTLLAHLRTGLWDSILPEHWVERLGQTSDLRTLPLRGEAPPVTVGLIIPPRDPPSTLAAALLREAAQLDRDS